MPRVERFTPHTFCWAELATRDVARARTFYSELLGWTISESPLPDGRTYTTFMRNGASVGAAFPMGAQYPPNTPSHWSLYVSVEDVDASTKRAKDAGATVIAEPFNVMNYGRMATFSDPAGSVLSLWQPEGHQGFGLIDEDGAPCWYELMTRDAAKVRDFYHRLLGWTFEVAPEYTEIKLGERYIGGMMEMTPEMTFPPMWSVYFQVPEIQPATERVKKLGGQTMLGPNEIPTVGWFSAVADPSGAPFNLFQTKMK